MGGDDISRHEGRADHQIGVHCHRIGIGPAGEVAAPAGEVIPGIRHRRQRDDVGAVINPAGRIEDDPPKADGVDGEGIAGQKQRLQGFVAVHHQIEQRIAAGRIAAPAGEGIPGIRAGGQGDDGGAVVNPAGGVDVDAAWTDAADVQGKAGQKVGGHRLIAQHGEAIGVGAAGKIAAPAGEDIAGIRKRGEGDHRGGVVDAPGRIELDAAPADRGGAERIKGRCRADFQRHQRPVGIIVEGAVERHAGGGLDQFVLHRQADLIGTDADIHLGPLEVSRAGLVDAVARRNRSENEGFFVGRGDVQRIGGRIDAPGAKGKKPVGVAGDHRTHRIGAVHSGIARDGQGSGEGIAGEIYRHLPVASGRSLGHPYFHAGVVAAAALAGHQGPAQAETGQRVGFPERTGRNRCQVEIAAHRRDDGRGGEGGGAVRTCIAVGRLMGDGGERAECGADLAVAVEGDGGRVEASAEVAAPAAEGPGGRRIGGHGDHGGAVIDPA